MAAADKERMADPVEVIARTMFDLGNRRLGVERDFDDPKVGGIYVAEATEIVIQLSQAGYLITEDQG